MPMDIGNLLKGVAACVAVVLSIYILVAKFIRNRVVDPELNEQAHGFLEDCIEKEAKICGERYSELKKDMTDRFDKLEKKS